MKNKGFTLIEVLAVITLLAILALIVTPKVLEQKENKEKQAKEAQKKVLYADASTYLRENKIEYIEPGNVLCVKVSTLISEGYNSMKAEDFKTKAIKVTVDENNNFIYSLLDNCSSVFKIGDYVRMTPTATSFKTDKRITGHSSEQTIYPSKLNSWRVININDDGSVDMVSERITSESVCFAGTNGYANYVGYLNVLASKYKNDRFTVSTRYIGYDNQTEYIQDTSYFNGDNSKVTDWTLFWPYTNQNSPYESLGGGEAMYKKDLQLVKTAIGNTSAVYCTNNDCSSTSGDYYFLASRAVSKSGSSFSFFPMEIYSGNSGNLTNQGLRTYTGDEWTESNHCRKLRPIVTLKYGVKPSSGAGRSDSPYVLE